MDHASPEAIKKQMKTMIMVFVALLFLTLVTVGASYLHLNLAGAIVLALFIATIKGGLLAAYFMHLISEKSLIYWVLIFSALFFAVMMALPLFQNADDIHL